MSDRLKELRQQRALVEQQLAWLDREIAAARGDEVSNPVRPAMAQPPATTAARLTQPVPPATTSADLAAEEIMAQYKQETHSLQSSVKRGCFIYFFVALGIVGLGVAALYFFKTKG